MSGDSKSYVDLDTVVDRGTLLCDLKKSYNHVSLFEVKPNYLVFKLPERYSNCDSHREFAPVDNFELGRGSFGRVSAYNSEVVCKQFWESSGFYHELFWCDLISLTKIRHPTYRDVRIVSPITACVPCKQIFFKRYSRSLRDFDAWRPGIVRHLVSEFEQLYLAVYFLNEKCGIMHSDISTDNILVDESRGGMRLYLTDFGVCSLHDGNPVTDVAIKTRKGHMAARVSSERSVFSISKDAYKPCAVLARCYVHMCSGARRREADEFLIHSATAIKIDVICLGVCLLMCLEKILDANQVQPLETFRDRFLDHCDSTTYYLQLLSPRIVLTQFLCTLWNISFSIRIDGQGVCQSVSLKDEHRRLFKKWNAAYLKLLEQSCTIESVSALNFEELKRLFIKLLGSDGFMLESV